MQSVKSSDKTYRCIANNEALLLETNAARRKIMKGFIIASVNEQAVKQSIGLESQVIRYTPVMGEDQETITEQFKEAFPDHIVIMTMPIDVLKKNIEVLEALAKQKDLALA